MKMTVSQTILMWSHIKWIQARGDFSFLFCPEDNQAIKKKELMLCQCTPGWTFFDMIK